MKHTFFRTLMLFSILFFATQIDAQEIKKEYHENGNLKSEGQYDANNKGTGEWKFYHESGKLEKNGNYLKGVPDGDWKYYDEKTGWLNDIVEYKDGEKFKPNKLGCYSGNCENGYGRKTSLGGYRQIGNFKNGKLNGKGYEIKSGNKYEQHLYEGDFVNGKKEGHGKGISLGGNYSGEWKAGKKHGKGKGIIDNSAKYNEYNGEWKEGEKDGYGTEVNNDFILNKTGKYVGYWKAGKKHGEGKEYKKGKLVYEGSFYKNRRKITSGCVVGDCENGYGVFILENKNKYIGEFRNGKKEGQGFEKDPQGNYIIGQWKNNKEDGLVRVYNPSNELMFSGQMQNGKPLKKPNKNAVEVGCIIGDCENGFGHYKWENGDIYIGEFKEYNPHGQGTTSWINGEKYIGDYVKGMLNGYGKYYDKDGNIVNEGKWIDSSCDENFKITLKEGKCIFGDCVNGYGVQEIPKSNNIGSVLLDDYDFVERYEGLWKDGERHGFGVIERANKGTYVGELLTGDYHGKGIINLKNGSSYNGDFEDGERHGQGIMMLPDGSKYVGDWEGGEKHGKGKAYDVTGKLIYEGKFYKGQRE
ncbi:MAG: hypothetical protein AB8F94_03540 [Saprospiraceae bacterium]